MSFSKYIFRRRHQRACGVFLICIFVIFITRHTFLNNHDMEVDSSFVVNVDDDDNIQSFGSDQEIPIKFVEHPIPEHQDSKSFEHAYISQATLDIRNLPEAPFILGGQQGGPKYFKKRSCARFPTLYNLQFSNTHWQVAQMPNATFYLFSAYYDTRIFKTSNHPSIRILAMVDQKRINHTAVCQLWFEDEKQPLLTWVREFKNIWQGHWSKLGVYSAYLITCKVPKSHRGKVPKSVSLVEGICTNATNNIRINNYENNLQKRRKFGVCVKGLDMLHNDKSIRLIEWIELMNILGADKIFFYEFSVNPNVKKVLDYYVSKGKVDVSPLTLPGYLPNDPRIRHLFLGKKTRSFDKRKNEVIPYNDCLYRNLNKYQYLAVLDTDEVLLPKEGLYWNELMENYENQRSTISRNSTRTVSSWCFRNVYFLDEMTVDPVENFSGIPKHLHMLQHVYRSANYTPPKSFIKCFHGTERTLTVHNHFPFSCLGGNCKIHHFDPEIAHMQHYRSNCVDDIKDCESYKKNSVLDTTVWKHKEELIQRVNNVMARLNIVV